MGSRTLHIREKHQPKPEKQTSALTPRTYLHMDMRERRSPRQGCRHGNAGAAPAGGRHAQKNPKLLWISFAGVFPVSWRLGRWSTVKALQQQSDRMLRLKPPGVATRHLYWLYSRIIFWHV